jgi:hypothetical protein
VSGIRLVVGAIVMGVVVPVMLFYLLGLSRLPQLFTLAAASFLAWGAADLLAVILERPRLKDRTPTKAIKDDWDRRAGE